MTLMFRSHTPAPPLACASQPCNRAAAATLLLILIALLSACQSVPPPQSAQVAQHEQVVVPFVPQEAYQCGPAALAMMLQWAGKPVSADALVDEVWLPERKGSLGIELMAAARSRGLLAYPVNDAKHLYQELQAGRPALVMQNLALPSRPKWHYAVVTGYHDEGKTVVMHSGTTQSKTTHWNRFIRTWARAEQWGFTLIAPGELPSSAEPQPLFRAISATPNAMDYWPQAVKAFPDSGELWFGYGNALWQDGDKPAALEAFEHAVKAAPEMAAAWNNLAFAQHQQGDSNAARRSLCKAMNLAPDDENILDTANTLGYSCPGSGSTSSGCCSSN